MHGQGLFVQQTAGSKQLAEDFIPVTFTLRPVPFGNTAYSLQFAAHFFLNRVTASFCLLLAARCLLEAYGFKDSPITNALHPLRGPASLSRSLAGWLPVVRPVDRIAPGFR